MFFNIDKLKCDIEIKKNLILFIIGLKVFRSRNLSSSEFEQNTCSNNTDGTINNEQIK